LRESPQHPGDGAVERSQVLGGVGQKMQQGNAEHQARHEADGNLQAGMGEPDN